MPIAIDGSRLLTKNPTGVEVYCQNIINGLLAKSNDLILYTPQIISDLPEKNQQILNWPLKKFWSQIRLGFELLIHPPTVFFSPGYVIPFLALFNKKTKKIVTIHDLGFVYTPESYSLFQKWFLKLTTKQAVKYAHKIITAAKATKDDLIKYFNCPEKKIEVTYFGITPHCHCEESRGRGGTTSQSRDKGILSRDRNAHRLNFAKQNLDDSLAMTERKKQILYIGRIEEKKNINNLIKAFQIFYQKHPDYKLILAGKPGHGFKNIQYQIANIQYLGYISAEQKKQLLSESNCLVFISKHEGFGFPILEAFDFGLPVVASDIPVLREIGGDACVYVNPCSPEDIVRGLQEAVETRRGVSLQEKIEKGRERLKDFDWQKCIEKTWQTAFSMIIYTIYDDKI